MQINLSIVLLIIVIHWFADFVLQTDWQAKNKSSDNWALSSHVMTYTLIWSLFSAAYMYATEDISMILFPFITCICHWTTDYFTSRLNTKLWKAGKVHEFFVSVGFDQVLHYTQLLLTYYLLTR